MGKNIIFGDWEIADDESGSCVLSHQTTGETYTFDSADGSFNSGPVHVPSLNNVRWAATPDDIQTELDALPSTGGVVKLKPGLHGPGSFTTGITIPNNKDAQITLDFRGCKIDIDSWDGTTMFSRDWVTGNRPARVNIIGGWFNAYDTVATSLTKFAELFDVTQSTFTYRASGEFDVGTHFRSHEGSSHHNNANIFHDKATIGLQLGVATDPLGVDRGTYRGQMINVGDAGCVVEQGMNNRLAVQTENPRSDVTNGDIDGYRITTPTESDNKIELGHRITGGTVGRPFNIQSNKVRIDQLAQEHPKLWQKSALSIPPRNISAPEYKTAVFDFSMDHTPNFETPVTGGSVTMGNYNDLILNSSTTGGNSAAIQTPSRIGPMGDGLLMFGRATNIPTASATTRFGIYKDANNYAMLVADPDTYTDWRVEIVSGGVTLVGRATAPTNSIAINGSLRDLSVFSGQDENGAERQYWYINHTLVMKTTETLGGGAIPAPQRMRLDLTTNGTPASAPQLNLRSLQYGANDLNESY